MLLRKPSRVVNILRTAHTLMSNGKNSRTIQQKWKQFGLTVHFIFSYSVKSVHPTTFKLIRCLYTIESS